MLSIIRASLSLMDEIRDIINSNYQMYEKILLNPDDHNEHFVDEQWAEQNFQIREFYLIRENGKYVGMTSYQNFGDMGDFAYIGYFYIKFGHHRKGYGKRVMQFLEMRAKSDQLKEIRLFVNKSADWAEKAYESMGFKPLTANKQEIISMNQGIFKDYYEEGQTLLFKTLLPLKPLKPANMINNSFSMDSNRLDN